MGTLTLEEKMDQYLTGLCHEPLLQVFLDVRKAYDSLDRGSCMEILRGYGLGYNLQRLLHRFGDDQAVVPKSGRFYGRPQNRERSDPGVTRSLQQSSALWWTQW